MKTKYINLLLITFVSVSLSGCVADLFEKEELHPPSVSISKVENNEFNESVLYFTVTEDENNEVDFIGVALKANERPRTTDRQQIYQGTTGSLALNLGLLSADTSYFIKAFAGNESGFAESEIFNFMPAAPIPVEAPCTLSNGRITEEGQSYSTFSSFASANSGGGNGNYGIETNYSSINGRRLIAFSFQSKPITGRYLNTSFSNFNQFSDDVYVHFVGSSGVFKTGKYVYIDVDNNDMATIEFCDLEYEFMGNTFSLSGSFSTSLR